MKKLSLLRHAKSGWDDPVARDFDRPLNPRGRRAARAVGERMKAEGLAFDLVLASPARRVVETLEEVEAGFGPLHAGYEQRIYLASTETLLDIVHDAGDGAGSLLLIGHNPGFERLTLLLPVQERCAPRSRSNIRPERSSRSSCRSSIGAMSTKALERSSG